MKRCARCGEEKQANAFRRRSGAKAHLLRSWCRPCESAATAAYQRAHPEQTLENNRRWAEQNRELKRSRDREQYARDPEKHKLRSKTYRATVAGDPKFRAKRVAHEHRRRARIRGNGFERYTRSELIERYGLVCHLCEQTIDLAVPYRDSQSFSIDHVHPIAAGGSDVLDNVRPAHFGCNSRKGHRLLQEA